MNHFRRSLRLLVISSIAASVSAAAAALKVEVAATGDEQTKLKAVATTVNALLSKNKLWDNFSAVAVQYTQIYVGQGFGTNGMTDAAGALALLRGKNTAYVVFPAQLVLTGTYYSKGEDYVGKCTNPAGAQVDCRATAFGQNYGNQTVVTHGIGGTPSGQREMVSIEIGREIFDRYKSKSKVRKSCTYNTVAHEWTHTIGKDQSSHWTVIVDTGSDLPAGVPKLSYLFGSVAQCTWLQNQGEVGGTDADLTACVAKFGTSEFNSLSCV